MYRYLPEASTTKELRGMIVVVEVDTPKGEPPMACKAPVVPSMLKPENVPSCRFATYRNFPDGSIVTQFGPFPTLVGELGTGVNAPEPFTAKPETVALFELATYRNLPEGVSVPRTGVKPAV